MTTSARERARRRPRSVLVVLAVSALLIVQLPAGPGALGGVATARAAVRPAVAAEPQVVWHLNARTFDPANGTDATSQTFVPTTTCYQVGVTLAGSNAGDDLYVQLGDNAQDAGEVSPGEQYFFVACHLEVGVMPVLRAVAVPGHDYGGRSLTYGVVVLMPLPVPQSVDGVATSTTVNTLLLKVGNPAVYTVHYHLSSGGMRVSVAAAGSATNVRSVSGDGGFSLNLPSGLVGIGLQPEPETGVTLDWTVQLGIAPKVRVFNPSDGSVLRQAPARLTVSADAPGQVVLDRKLVSSKYDAATGLLSYAPPQPLAAGIHIVEVAGADGTLASRHATFWVLPSLSVRPSGAPAGTMDGQAWVRTSTPDGRYSLRLPGSWEMAARDGTVLLAEPHGAALVQASERMLGEPIDATTVAHQVASHFPGTPQFAAVGAGVTFSTTLAGKKGTKAKLAFLVLPSPARHSLLLALGLSDASQPALSKQVTTVLSSFRANGDAGVRAARSWLDYQHAGFSFYYPAGWVGDFTSTDLAVLVGPFDQAYVVGESIDYSGPATSTDMAAAGRQVEATMHTNLHVQAAGSGTGAYRWLGTYTVAGAGGNTLYVELGQVVASHGRLQVLWADTSAELAPSNVPVLARSLDSAARSAGVAPPLGFTVAAAVQGMSTQAPASVLEGKAGGQAATSPSDKAVAQENASMENFTGQMIEDQTASDMTQESIQFSDYMNSEYGDGSDIWQPTFYGG